MSRRSKEKLQMGSAECKQVEEDWEVHREAKDILKDAVGNKEVFNNYLDSVVKVSACEYPDMKQLMDRCQALVATRLVTIFVSNYTKSFRNSLQDHLVETNKQIEEQEQSLEKFKESKMKQTLNYNVKLTDLQRASDAFVSKTQENKRILFNIDEINTDKRYY